MLFEAQLIDPNFTALHLTRIIAHTNHQGLHLAKRRIAHEGHLIARVIAVISHVRLRERCQSLRFGTVALLLECRKDAKRHIQHIVFRPYRLAIFQTATAILTFRSQLQRYLIFIIVVLVVATQTNKHRKLIVTQIRNVLRQSIGMSKHLDALVLAQVERRVLIDCLCLPRTQILDGQAQCLLIRLDQLRLGWVLLTLYAWRQDVVDRGFLRIFLNADRTCLQCSTSSGTQRLVVGTPCTTHQVKRTKTQDDWLLEVGQEHTHETDA